MTTPGILPLILFAGAAAITPGGATMLATASGAHFGYRRSLPLIAGITASLASMAAAAALGLGGIILAVPSLSLVMKLAGSVYLAWLAWQIARRGPPHLAAQRAMPMRFRTALWLQWCNPKGWAMTLGAAASFASLVASPLGLAALLSGLFAVCAILSLSLWCLGGLVLTRLLRSAAQWHAVNAVLGALIIASLLPLWLD